MTLRELYDQILLELEYSAALVGNNANQRQPAVKITREFAALLPSVRKLIESDLRAAFEGDPAARSEDEVVVCYPGIAAIIHHRLTHNLIVLGAPLVTRLIAEIAHLFPEGGNQYNKWDIKYRVGDQPAEAYQTKIKMYFCPSRHVLSVNDFAIPGGSLADYAASFGTAADYINSYRRPCAPHPLAGTSDLLRRWQNQTCRCRRYCRPQAR